MIDISLIVAKAQNDAIGKDNDLLWKIRDDLKRFKKLTSHHVVIHGKKKKKKNPHTCKFIGFFEITNKGKQHILSFTSFNIFDGIF